MRFDLSAYQTTKGATGRTEIQEYETQSCGQKGKPKKSRRDAGATKTGPTLAEI